MKFVHNARTSCHMYACMCMSMYWIPVLDPSTEYEYSMTVPRTSTGSQNRIPPRDPTTQGTYARTYTSNAGSQHCIPTLKLSTGSSIGPQYSVAVLLCVCLYVYVSMCRLACVCLYVYACMCTSACVCLYVYVSPYVRM